MSRSAKDVRTEMRLAIEKARNELVTMDGGRAFFYSILAQLPYMVSFEAPVLNPPIGILDILDGRLFHPHPDFYNPTTGTNIDKDLHQGHHALQCAALALERGYNDDVVVASFLHDFGKLINRRKHTYFSAELMRPYVSEKVHWLILNHLDVNHIVMPEDPRWENKTSFEEEAHRVQLDLSSIKNSPWFDDLLKVRECDEGGRIRLKCPEIRPDLERVLDRSFKLSKAGLAYDKSSAAELWKLIVERAWMT
jgi:hypothetical protein